MKDGKRDRYLPTLFYLEKIRLEKFVKMKNCFEDLREKHKKILIGVHF